MQTARIGFLFLTVAAAGQLEGEPAGADEQRINALEDQIDDLRAAVAEQEILKHRLEALEHALAEAKDDLAQQQRKRRQYRAKAREQHFELTERVKRIEEDYPTAAVSKPAGIRLGGSLWLNYAYRDFDDADQTRVGNFDFDLFRLSAEGARDNILFSVQYRFYGFMDTIHHGWIGYNFSEHSQWRLGITKVPFGALPFASHSYWFGLPYYLGLEDDYDAGLKLVHAREPWNLQLAFFKNEEFGSGGSLNRYSFDVVGNAAAGQFNEESNQLNLRAARKIDEHTEVGVSAQWGQLYNRRTDDNGDHWAGAFHVNHFQGPWNMQLELIRYGFNPRNPSGIGDTVVEMGAFGVTRAVVAEGDLLVANIARSFAVDWGAVTKITCYNDYSRLYKDAEGLQDSELNTLGCRVPTASAYTYVDLIAGRNATFLNDSRAASGLGAGAADDVELRFNINFEYYF